MWHFLRENIENGPPVSLTAQQLSKIGIGQKYTSYAGCCPNYLPADALAVCKTKGFNYPQTGEFQYAAGDQCDICAFGYGLECTGSIFKGQRPAVVRQSYAADSDACCKQQPSTYLIGDKTCDPQWTPASQKCNNPLAIYCAQGSNIFTQDVCKKWENAHRDDAWDIKKKACSAETAIKSNAQCRTWIINEGRQSSYDNMDYEIADYCAANPQDTICACLVSQGKNIPCPHIFDKNCVQKVAYKTQKMMETQCPPYIDCSQYVNISDKATLTDTAITQECKMSIGTEEKKVDNTSPISDKRATSIFQTIPIWMITLVVVLILLIISAIIMIVIYGRR
jgi:hypothetical protein